MAVWERTLGAGLNAQSCIVRVDDAQGLPLFAVFLAVRRVGRLGTRVLSFMDAGVCDYNAPILFEPLRPIPVPLRVLWRRIQSAVPSHDIVSLEKMPSTVKGAPNPLWLLGDLSHPSRCHAMTLPLDWETFEREKGRHTIVKAARSNLRTLDKHGPTRMLIAEKPSEIDRLFDALVAQKRRQFKETGVKDLFDSVPGFEAFYRGSAGLANLGVTHLSGLCVGDEPVATIFGFLDRDYFYGVLTAYTRGQWARYSCGNLHIQMLLRWAIEHGLTRFDFGIGDENYKMFWCDQHVELHDTRRITSLKGHAHATLSNVRGKARSALRWLGTDRNRPTRSGMHCTGRKSKTAV